MPEVTLSPPARGEDLLRAEQFGVRPAAARDPGHWQMLRIDGRLTLCSPDELGPLQLDLDLSRGPLANRLRGANRRDPLARAVGLPKRQAPPRVVDATAGLCRDAMVLAHLGCRVTALERIPALALLAADAMQGTLLGSRILVVAADAVHWLEAMPADQAPDVVYLDPMFDEAGRAQVKKDMQVCRALAGPPGDTARLFAAARRAARERVVVKRHPHLPALAPGVSFTVDGERVRFDVYLADAGRAGRKPLSGSRAP